MKTIYTKDNCAGCVYLKSELISKGEPFKEIRIGKDISREDFMKKFPDVKRIPFVTTE